MTTATDFPPATPLEASRLIQFSLAALTGDNGHHEFETLCRMLAREHITPNVIPSTGPVSAGGDQGVDFETHSVTTLGRGTRFFALATPESWVFACSLQKDITRKIRVTVRELVKVRKVDKLFFFHSLPIPVAKKHALEAEAMNLHKQSLEILDSYAISEMLAHPDTLWICHRFLNLPASVTLQHRNEEARWYAPLLNEDSDEMTEGKFFELKDAVRTAAHSKEHRQDALTLFAMLRRYRNFNNIRISRKAIYEEFVASLRGLGFCDGYEADIRSYMSSLDSLNDASDLEDAANLLSYVVTASRVESFPIAYEELLLWHNTLTKQVAHLIGQTSHLPRLLALKTAQSPLILTKAFLQLIKNGNDCSLNRDTLKAVSLWSEMADLASDAPLFPIERLADLADAVAVLLEGEDEYRSLQRKLDALLSERAGKQALVDRHIARAIVYLEAERRVSALRETHFAHLDVIEPRQAVNLCLMLSKSYLDLGLYFAGKYYALASSYAALRLPDEDLRVLGKKGFVEAAQADYASGASILFLLTASLFAVTERHYSGSVGSAPQNASDPFMMFYLYLMNLRFWSGYRSAAAEKVMQEAIQRWDLVREYEELNPHMFTSNPISEFEDLRQLCRAENVAMPFSDLGGERVVQWVQLGITWTVRWRTEYDLQIVGEAICAFLQIALAELADVELSLIGKTADLEIVIGPTSRVSQQPTNDRFIAKVTVAISETGEQFFASTLAAAVFVLDHISAQKENMLSTIKRRFDDRLIPALQSYGNYKDIYATFYPRDLHDTFYAAVRDEPLVEPLATQTAQELAGRSGLHPSYSKEEAQEQVKNRYRRLLQLMPFTLERLKRCKAFLETVDVLKGEGWKDWHILTAVMSIRINTLHGDKLRWGSQIGNEHFRRAINEIETASDPNLPCEFFDEEGLTQALKMSAMTTFQMLGFSFKSQTPDIDETLRFLGERMRYWEDDVPHASPFTD